MKCNHCGKEVTKVTAKKVYRPRRREVVTRGTFNLEYAESLEIELKQMVADNEHFVHIANKLKSYYELTGYAERTMAHFLGISKSEIHRLVLIAYMSDSVKNAATTYNTEKYVLLEWSELRDQQMRNYLYTDLVAGTIRKRKQLKQRINKYAIEFGSQRTGNYQGLVGREGAQA
jgi:hypothetical protein